MIRAETTPAVAYYRMSSKKQDKSIPAQRVEVEKYAAAHGYTIIRWQPYVDEGISGSESEKREGFQRLMRDATERGDFRVILCWDQDRFSRFDPLEANHYWYLLRNAGVRIVTVRQGELDLSELGGWLVASVTQHGKAQYLKDLSANVLRGRLRKAEKGLWAGSRAPYAYALTKEGKIVLGDADQIETVRWIFATYAARDISLREIANLLNDRDVDSPAGGDWIGTTVQAILRRQAYLGSATQFRQSKGKFFTISNGSVAIANGTSSTKAAREWFTVDCPPIIDQELWDRCAAKLVRRRARTTPRKDVRGLLNGLLYCGHCGKRMFASNQPMDSAGDPVYCCSTYNSVGGRGCNRNLTHQTQLLPFLIEKIQELVLAPANFDRLRAEVRRQVGKLGDGPADGKAALRVKIGKLDKEIRAAAAELKRTPDDLYDLAVDDLRTLRTKREQAAAQLEALEARVSRPRADLEQRAKRAIEGIQGLGQSLTSADPATVREALNRICERVELWFDHKKSAKLTRSYFRKGIVRFRKPTDLYGPASRPR